jgi:hypothetical protein
MRQLGDAVPVLRLDVEGTEEEQVAGQGQGSMWSTGRLNDMDPLACHKRGSRRSTGVTPAHGGPQIKAWTRTRFVGFPGPRSGIAQGPGPVVGRSPREWVSRHAGAGGVADLRDKLADATGYPLPTPPVLQQANTPRVPLTPVNHGQHRDTVTWPDCSSRALTAQWAQPSKLGLRCDRRRGR